MPSSFPGALDNISSNKGESTVTANDHAPHHNALADAINAVQTALGVNLSGAAAAAPVQSVAGKTGSVTLAKADVGLGNADNTSDANKPVSTATQTALDAKVSSVTTGITGADQITNMVSLTQAEYDAIGTKNASTLYVIAG
jgi:hypothetical protein